MSKQHLDGLVQPIAVPKDSSHTEAILAGALASYKAYLDHPDHPAWDQWLSGPFGKTARRASEADLRRLTRYTIEHPDWPVAAVTVGATTAYGMLPATYDDFPKPVAKMQVSGTDFSRTPSPFLSTPGAGVVVDLWVSNDLTTGKAIAQAAHALWLALLDQPVHGPGLFNGTISTTVTLVPAKHVTAREFPTVYVVKDAGLTEVEPGTITASAVIRNT